ncbi:hypothetical protein BCO71171_07356 [Burkholderia contaminans]|uniref:Uncharacterized protein n=1 Tax=Burkholderia contaminans TaxID=488447 RepID=A0A6P3C264_9BURK|nr:hypothetical protein BCO71171_07356 [Burkholderia contaminans]
MSVFDTPFARCTILCSPVCTAPRSQLPPTFIPRLPPTDRLPAFCWKLPPVVIDASAATSSLAVGPSVVTTLVAPSRLTRVFVFVPVSRIRSFPASSCRLPAFTFADVRSMLFSVFSDISPPLCSAPNALSICLPWIASVLSALIVPLFVNDCAFWKSMFVALINGPSIFCWLAFAR